MFKNGTFFFVKWGKNRLLYKRFWAILFTQIIKFQLSVFPTKWEFPKWWEIEPENKREKSGFRLLKFHEVETWSLYPPLVSGVCIKDLTCILSVTLLHRPEDTERYINKDRFSKAQHWEPTNQGDLIPQVWGTYTYTSSANIFKHIIYPYSFKAHIHIPSRHISKFLTVI